MTRRTLFGSRPVEQNSLVSDHAGRFVAVDATHVLMRAAQGKARPRLVVEQGRFPLVHIVTVGTGWRLAVSGKLLRMRVLVAPFALQGS